MASDLIRGPRSFIASADLSASQFKIVSLDANGQIQVALHNGGRALGVLQDKPKAQGDPCTVCAPGDITKIVAGGAIGKGGYFMNDGNGRAVAFVSGGQILGQCLDENPVNAGDIVRFVFQPVGAL